MNFITHNMAYSLYPRATFDERVAFKLRSDKIEGTRTAYKKYSERGWNFVIVPWQYRRLNGALEHLMLTDVARSLDDRYTWRVSLNTAGLELDGPSNATHRESTNDMREQPQLQDKLFQRNSWTLRSDYDFRPWTRMKNSVEHMILHSERLKQTHCVAREAESEMQDSIEKILNSAMENGAEVEEGSRRAYVSFSSQVHS